MLNKRTLRFMSLLITFIIIMNSNLQVTTNNIDGKPVNNIHFKIGQKVEADYNGETFYIQNVGNIPYKYKKFLSSGTFIAPLGVNKIDVFCVGGGGGGGGTQNASGGGGGGGYTKTVKNYSVTPGNSYTVTVGLGGIGGKVSASYNGRTGGASIFNADISTQANGGTYGGYAIAGNGGSGGGSGGHQVLIAGGGGSDGSNGGIAVGTGGIGQGTTTREFGEVSGALYSGGGGGSASLSQGGGAGGAGGGASGTTITGYNGFPNTGGGGGGALSYSGESTAGNGGSGIVIVRWVANTLPIINITTPSLNSTFSAVAGFNSTTIQGTIVDYDSDDKNYLQYNIDGGANNYLTIITGKSGNDGNDYITADGTAKAFTTAAIDFSALAEGPHTLNIIAADNNGGTSTIPISFIIDKTPPAIGIFNISSFDTSINVMGTATDNQGLNIKPYQYTISTKTSSGWVTNTSFSQGQLIPNTYYSIKFEAKDIVGNIAQLTKYAYTKASTPQLTISNLTSTTIDIKTSDSNPATTTQYQIQVNNTQYVTPEGTLTSSPIWFTLPNKNLIINGLTPETTYTFKIKARNTEGIETDWSSPVSGTTLVAPPIAPANIISTATNNSITVVWDPVAGSTGYEIEADGKIVDVGTYTSYIHENLVQFTQHTYRVRAKNAGGFGAWSNQISKYTQQNNPNTPFNIDAAANNTSIIVTWKPIPGATAYDIEADGVIINNYSSTNYVHSGLIPGTMHSYRVRSINSAGKSEWSNEILVSTQLETPAAPSNVTTHASGSAITVTWNPVQGTTYEIEVDGSIKDNGTSSTFVHSGLASGSTHKYRVRAKQSGSISNWSTYVTRTIPMNEFGTPQNIQADATNTTIALSWNPVIDAIGYDVEVNGVVTDNGTGTSCLFSALSPNTQHIYRIRAKGIGKVSEWSEYKPVMTYALPTPTSLTTFATGDSVSITWNGVPGAASYDLDIDGEPIQNITATEYVHTLIDKNVQHTYKVRAKNAAGFSAWSKAVSQVPQTGGTNAPAGVMAKSLTNSIQMLWKPIPGATGYDIEVDGAIVQGIKDTNYTHNGLEPGTQHSYRVRAVTNGVQTDWSNTAVVMTLPVAPPTPSNITVSSTTSSVLVTWDKLEGVTAYELEVDGQIIDTGINTKYLHSNLAPDSSHTYRVRAKNLSDWSLWSEALTTKTKSAVQTYDIQTTSGQVFNLVLTANDITDPSKYTYTITYNAEELEVLDLCAATSRTDMTIGGVVGADIQIVQYTPGTIVFKKLGTSAGQAWTGQINSIKFKSKTDNATQVIYSFE